ncbi:MAG: FtsQ-type POTRA domain-containing protein [Oscillospiraceae bacterium]|jgi:cell division protein FtsQ|nr:FtsQ-type POTRA domain-containing protein [Oscillospiraceae bacterium]
MKLFWYVIALAVLVFALSLFLQANAIGVEGNTRYGTEEIIAASQLMTGGSLVVFDKSGAEQRVKDAFPYVERVTVKRKLPDTLMISITESVPLARIRLDDGTVALIERNGKVVEVAPGSTEGIELRGLTPLNCVPGEPYPTESELDAEALDYALEILAALDANGLSGHVTYIQAGILVPSFDYDGYFTVEIGTRERTAEKIEFFAASLDSMPKGFPARIDLSIVGYAHYIPL